MDIASVLAAYRDSCIIDIGGWTMYVFADLALTAYQAVE